METPVLRSLYRPSGINSHFSYSGSSFAAYVEHMRDIVEAARIDLTDENRERIIDANSPFEWIPARDAASNFNAATRRFRRGILLVHGLFDSPCVMSCLAEHFYKQGYLVRALLLPGHGTVPGDLLTVSYHEWLHAIRFAINSFADDVDALYLCGYSTGAALLLHETLKNPLDISRGLIFLAPAIQLKRQLAMLSSISPFLRRTLGGMQWYIKADARDYAKYHSCTINSAYQIYTLTRNNHALLRTASLKTPVFIAASADDELLDTERCVNFFNHTRREINRCIIYTNHPFNAGDKRVEVRPSHHPEKNILSFSHVSIPVSPAHTHYGEHGDYQDLHHYQTFLGKRYKNRPQSACMNNIYYGAISRAALNQFYLRKLTYNPDFAYMLRQINLFADECLL